MTTKTESVFQVWLSLSADERSEVIRLINEYIDGDYYKRRQIQESIQRKANLGPVASNICPYCGK